MLVEGGDLHSLLLGDIQGLRIRDRLICASCCRPCSSIPLPACQVCSLGFLLEFAKALSLLSAIVTGAKMSDIEKDR